MKALREPVRDGGMLVSDCTLIRELGSRTVPTYASHRASEKGEPELVIVERLARVGTATNHNHTALVMSEARQIARLKHPNVVRVRDVVMTTKDLLIVSDYVDGESHRELMRAATAQGRVVPLAVHLRVLVDMLLGLSGLHGLRDEQGGAVHVFHGEIDPANVLVGLDGTARLAHACRLGGFGDGAPAGTSFSHSAPEILLKEKTADLRSDIYSCGVILWEVLSGKRLFADAKVPAILKRQIKGIEPATVPADAPWAAPLVAVAAHALSADPAARFGAAADMAAEVRKIAGAKLASKTDVGALVAALAGSQIRARRTALAPKRAMDGNASAGPGATSRTLQKVAPRVPTPTTPRRALPLPAQRPVVTAASSPAPTLARASAAPAPVVAAALTPPKTEDDPATLEEVLPSALLAASIPTPGSMFVASLLPRIQLQSSPEIDPEQESVSELQSFDVTIDEGSVPPPPMVAEVSVAPPREASSAPVAPAPRAEELPATMPQKVVETSAAPAPMFGEGSFEPSPIAEGIPSAIFTPEPHAAPLASRRRHLIAIVLSVVTIAGLLLLFASLSLLREHAKGAGVPKPPAVAAQPPAIATEAPPPSPIAAPIASPVAEPIASPVAEPTASPIAELNAPPAAAVANTPPEDVAAAAPPTVTPPVREATTQPAQTRVPPPAIRKPRAAYEPLGI